MKQVERGSELHDSDDGEEDAGQGELERDAHNMYRQEEDQSTNGDKQKDEGFLNLHAAHDPMFLYSCPDGQGWCGEEIAPGKEGFPKQDAESRKSEDHDKLPSFREND